MVKPYAKFFGFQEDPRIGGYRAYYIIYAPGFERNLSTVFAATLRELNITVPVTPEYVDAQKTNRWLHKCEECQITYLTSAPCVKHKHRHKDHNLVSVRVPVLNVEPFEHTDSRIYIKDPKTGTLVEDVKLLQRARKRTPEEPSDFVKDLRKKYNFLN